MSFKRFVAASMREAMTQLRRDLGDDAVILSSRRIGKSQFEILAAASSAVDAIVEEARRPQRDRAGPSGANEQSFEDYVRRQSYGIAHEVPSGVRAYSAVSRAEAHDDAPASSAGRAPAPAVARHGSAAESTLFRRRPSRELRGQIMQIADGGPAAMSPTAAATSAPLQPIQAAARLQVESPTINPAFPQPSAAVTWQAAHAVHAPAGTQVSGDSPRNTTHGASLAGAAMSLPSTASAVDISPAARIQSVAAVPAANPSALSSPSSEQLMAELTSLRTSLQQQLSSLSSSVAATESMRRNPLQTRVMTRLLSGGFSADLSRRIALKTPRMNSIEEADAWLQEVIALNLRCAGPEDSLIDARGAFALVGPTGVGKTTTVAKLAARFAVKYGASALGLVTLDAYRIAAHEQLRAYGRILGVPVHMAQDGATLRELLSSMRGRRLVLVDTCGLGPRDDRLGEMLGMLAHAGLGTQKVQPVLLLNASSHAETLDDAARAWGAADAAGTILTKLDEAARIGGALDCALRHKLKLLALTNGQRVPEDIHAPRARLLAHLSLKPSAQHFTLADDESAAMATLPATSRGAAHA